MIALLVLAPLARDWVVETQQGVLLLSPNPETSVMAAASVGVMLLMRVVLYGIGPGWLAAWVLRQALR